MAMSKPTVCIIGAGVAGLSCAKHLTDKNVAKVTIFEALDRLGGRLWTKHFEDHQGGLPEMLEMGANFIHGYDGNPIAKLAEENTVFGKLTCVPTTFNPENVLTIAENGQVVSEDVLLAVGETYATLMAQCSEFVSNGLPTGFGPESSLEDYFKAEAKSQLIKACGNDKQDMLKECQDWVNSMLTIEAIYAGSDSVNELSLQQYGAYTKFPGGDKVVVEGYSKILEILAHSIPKEDIHMNSVVQSIHWASDSENGKVKVTLSDGTEHVFDHVVVTCSLGFLKKNKDTFIQPSLPERKLQAINNLGFGFVEKIFLIFDNLDFLPDKAIILGWGIHDSDTKSPEPIPNWARKIRALICMEPAKNTALATFISGDAARQLQNFSDEEVMEGYMAVLKHFLDDKNIPRPLKVIRSNWSGEPYAKGAYSFMKTGASVKDIEALAEPLKVMDSGRPRVQFAGEASHPQYFSTVHGAYMTGEREAARLEEYYSK